MPPTIVPASQDLPLPPSDTTPIEIGGSAGQLPLREDDRRRMSASSTGLTQLEITLFVVEPFPNIQIRFYPPSAPTIKILPPKLN